MGSRKTLILVAAVAVGAIASLLVWSYVSGIREEAYGDAERVKVYVAETEIAQGTFGDEAKAQQLIVEDEIPREFFPPNAIKSLDELSGKQAISGISPNQTITADMFADPAEVQSTFADRLGQIRGQDQTAISISVDKVRGVAHLLQPGDYVNVMLTQVCQPLASPDGATPEGTGGNCEGGESEVLFQQQARYLYQKAQILAIDQTPVAQAGEVTAASAEGGGEAPSAEGDERGMVTLIVPADAAQYIASAEPASIYLSLVARDYEPKVQGPIDFTQPLPAEDPAELTPYGPDGPGK